MKDFKIKHETRLNGEIVNSFELYFDKKESAMKQLAENKAHCVQLGHEFIENDVQHCVTQKNDFPFGVWTFKNEILVNF